MLYFILRYILRYRLKVVTKNIARSFPELSEKERALIVNNFYRHFIRQNFESLQFMFISANAIKRRFVFENIEIVNNIADKGQNITLVFGHYATWDWIASIPLWSDKLIFATLYKQIKNKIINNLFLKIRSKFGALCIEKKQVLRSLIALKQENKPNLIAYIADQNTTIKNVHYWINFLNQDTAVQSGWATIARKFNTPVIYLKVKPIKKGYYTAHFEVITETPNLISEEDLIKSYFAKLERDIKELPEYWLWSHKRWKHKRIKSDTTNP
jgi:KDO2-lipid IV(A) lauroyltransferase